MTLRNTETTKVAHVLPEATLGEAYELLDSHRPGSVVICDGDDVVLGIFTDRDVLKRTALEGLSPSTPIRELMTPAPTTLTLDHSVADAVEAMTRGGLRHIPLVDGLGRLAGHVSSRDVLRFVASHYPESVLNLPPRLHQLLQRPEGG